MIQGFNNLTSWGSYHVVRAAVYRAFLICQVLCLAFYLRYLAKSLQLCEVCLTIPILQMSKRGLRGIKWSALAHKVSELKRRNLNPVSFLPKFRFIKPCILARGSHLLSHQRLIYLDTFYNRWSMIQIYIFTLHMCIKEASWEISEV